MHPSVMHHPEPKDAWDDWENEKYAIQWKEQTSDWGQMVARARRAEKLQRMRAINWSYCNKCDRKYLLWKERQQHLNRDVLSKVNIL